MTEVTQIETGIKGRIALVLGSGYKELAYVENPEKNNWNQIDSGYGVIANQGNEISGVNQRYTMSHEFIGMISGRYIEDSYNDTKLRQVKSDFVEKVLDIYKDLINTKAGAPDVVMNIVNLSIPVIEIDDEAKIVLQKFNFNVIYRIQL